MSGNRRSVWLSKQSRPSTNWTPSPNSLFFAGTSSTPCQVRLGLLLWSYLLPEKKKKKRSLLKRHLCSVTAHSFLFTVVARSSNIRKYTLILVLEYGKFNHSNKAEPTVLITCASYLIICASYENGTDSHVSPFFTYRRQTWIAFGSHIHKHNLLLSFPSFLCFYFSCLCSCFFSFKWQANLNWINFFLSLYYLACVLSCFHRVQLFAAL